MKSSILLLRHLEFLLEKFCFLICCTICSSGTSQGRPKFVPFTDELMETTMQIFQTSFAFRNR